MTANIGRDTPPKKRPSLPLGVVWYARIAMDRLAGEGLPSYKYLGTELATP